jgi:tRNA U34 5-methylaminomethyl-2-thiouridine-forming methyltransferase MnmC
MGQALDRHITTSADGSTTLWVPGLDEHYHSIHGALTESLHVFIEAGFKKIQRSPLRILEVGLGTALNARLTFDEALLSDRKVHYTALEKYPLNANEIEALGAAGMEKEVPFLGAKPYERELHGGLFEFTLIPEDLKTWTAPAQSFDLIYFDAFAPSAQPDLWTLEVFEKMAYVLASGGALVTYCAKGDVKRSMKAAGLRVERLPGPPRKREMTRAWKD